MNSEFVLGLIGSGCGWFALTRASFMREESFLHPKQAARCWGHLRTSLGGALIVISQKAGADSFDTALFPDSPPLKTRKGRGEKTQET